MSATDTHKNTIAARQLARVRVELQRSKEPIRAAVLGQRAGLDVVTTTNMLVRLRTEGLAWEAGKTAYTPSEGKKCKGKTITLWAWHTLRPDVVSPGYTRHVPSSQPNGSTEYWAKHMADMSAPARMGIQP